MSRSVAPFVLVAGPEEELAADGGAAARLRQLGARVETMPLLGEVSALDARGDDRVRAIVVEAGNRPDLAIVMLRKLRGHPTFSDAPAILSVPESQVARVDPASGFDDFIVAPCLPAELYARIRALEWRRSEFFTEERLKMGPIVIDRVAHEVTVEGRPVTLTAKEWSLLSFLAANRGRVFDREQLLQRVWGTDYDGGARTIDIHVRRLRAKLGGAFPLETMRGAGYKLRTPSDMGDVLEPLPVARVKRAIRSGPEVRAR